MINNKYISIFEEIIVIILFLCLILLILFFGITIGTLFYTVFMFSLLLVKTINVLYRNHSKSKSLKAIRNTTNTLFILFIISFIIIEFIIIYSTYSSPNSIESQEISSKLNASSISSLDYVIILGAGLEEDKISRRLEKRLITGVYYLKLNDRCKVIVSGGQGEDEDIPEAEAMGNYLISKGISEDRILYEKKSTSTIENLLFSKEIIKKNSIIENPYILIISSDYHLFRTGMIADKLGLTYISAGSKSELSVRVNYLIREYFAVLKDWIFVNILYDSNR